jgi:hypothetical protein
MCEYSSSWQTPSYNSIMVRWRAPVTPGGDATILTYKIEWKKKLGETTWPDTQSVSQTVDAYSCTYDGDATSYHCYSVTCMGGGCSISNLRASTAYEIRVLARNSDELDGPWWNPSGDSYTVTTTSAVPPDSPTIETPSKDAFSVTIKFVMSGTFDDGGSSISTFYLSVDGETDIDVGGTGDYKVSGLSPDTTYEFKAKAKNSAESSTAYSTVLSVKTAVNDKPVVALSGGSATKAFEEGASALTILDAESVLITDANNVEVQSATVQILPFETGDTLSFVDTADVTATMDIEDGILTLTPTSGSGTRAFLEDAFRAVKVLRISPPCFRLQRFALHPLALPPFL